MLAFEGGPPERQRDREGRRRHTGNKGQLPVRRDCDAEFRGREKSARETNQRAEATVGWGIALVVNSVTRAISMSTALFSRCRQALPDRRTDHGYGFHALKVVGSSQQVKRNETRF